MRVNPNLSPTTPVAGAIIVPYFMDVETQVPRGKGAACWGSKWKDAGAREAPRAASTRCSPLLPALTPQGCGSPPPPPPPVQSLSLSLPPPPSGNTALGLMGLGLQAVAGINELLCVMPVSC